MSDRQIKFRAWDTIKKVMYSAEEMGRDELTLNPDGRGFVNVHGVSTKLSHYLPHLIPLQFTGLLDKNGKEIYEGDILDNEWATKWWNAKWVLCNPINEPAETSAKEILDEITAPHSIVTGSIFSNPELLQSQVKEK